MAIDSLITIATGAVKLGPINFDLYTFDSSDKMVLFCRSGFEITDHHKKILENIGGKFFIKYGDKDAYVNYAFENLGAIISSPRIKTKEKAEILNEVSKRSVHKLLQDPFNPETFKQIETVVDNHVDLILSSPQAAGELFALSTLDSYTYSHSINVATLNMLIGEKYYNGDNHIMWKLGMAGLLHDIGKTMVNQTILFKKGRLSESEFEEMKLHATHSEKIISQQHDDPDLILPGKQHHEKFTGGGYPDNITGASIHPFARITAVSDVYDAITSKRVYKDQRPHIEALEIMAAQNGHFDPSIFDVLLQIVLRHKDLVTKFKIENLLELSTDPVSLSASSLGANTEELKVG